MRALRVRGNGRGNAYLTADPFYGFAQDFDSLLNSVWGVSPASPTHRSPRIDVTETEDGYNVAAELPGVAKDELEVTLEENVLTIRGEKKSETETDKENAHVAERTYGSFERILRLPEDVDSENIDAAFKDGVLKVTLPKVKVIKEEAKKIAVRAG